MIIMITSLKFGTFANTSDESFADSDPQDLVNADPDQGQKSVLCRIAPSGSVPHRYRTNLNFVCGSLRYDLVYNLYEDSKNVFKIMLFA